MGCMQSTRKGGKDTLVVDGVLDTIQLQTARVELTVGSMLSDTSLRRMEMVCRSGLPHREAVPGCVVFCDISGFTKFIEASNNTEESTKTINSLLSLVSNFAYHCGGDVLKFAGDAVLVLFAGNGETESELAHRGIVFGTRLLHFVDKYNDTELDMHIGVGVGQVSSLHVGGHGERWEHVVAGPVLAQIRCVDTAGPGQMCVSPEVWAYVSGGSFGEDMGDGFYLVYETRLPPESPLLPLQNVEFEEIKPRHTKLSPEAKELAKKYVPKQVVSLLDSGHVEFMCEFRRVTVLFINLDGLQIQHPESLGRLNAVVNIIFKQLQHFEGTLRQLIIDDKGTVAILCFGLRPAHADDPVRGVQAALNIQREIREGNHGIISSIGVTTGRSYCAIVGDNRRAEYACVGSSVNKSARLMGKAKGTILCDESTFHPCESRITFLGVKHMALKGFTEDQAVYTPVDSTFVSRGVLPPDISQSCRMWGREAEFEKVRLWIDQTSRTGLGGMAIIEADSGMGKSLILQRVVAGQTGTRVVRVAPSAIQSYSPYYVCVDLFMQVFGIKRRHDEKAQDDEDELQSFNTAMAQLQLALQDQVQSMGPQATDRWPLVGDVFPFPNPVPDNQFTKNLHGLGRATATRLLLVNILEVVTNKTPLLVVVDDLHCMDQSSWLLLVDVASLVGNVVVLAAAHTSVAKSLPDYHSVVEEDWVMRVKLHRLRRLDITSIVCEYLDVKTLSPQLERVIVRASGGNPFFALETAKLFRLRSEIEVTPEIARFAAGGPPTSLQLPAMIQGQVDQMAAVSLDAIPTNPATTPISTRSVDSGRQEILSASLGHVLAGKMDLLTVPEQTTLKVASVIGQRFHKQCLLSVVPAAQDQTGADASAIVAKHLQRLVRAGILQRMQQKRYAFCGSLMHDFVYNGIPHTTRRKYHLTTARWLQQHPMYATQSRWMPKAKRRRRSNTKPKSSTSAAAKAAKASKAVQASKDAGTALAAAAPTTPTPDPMSSSKVEAVEKQQSRKRKRSRTLGLAADDATAEKKTTVTSPGPFTKNTDLSTGMELVLSATRPSLGGRDSQSKRFTFPPEANAKPSKLEQAAAPSSEAKEASIAGVTSSDGGTPTSSDLGNSSTLLALLVYHFLRGHDFQAALDCAVRLGEVALQANGYNEAIRSFRKALAIDEDLTMMARQQHEESEGNVSASEERLFNEMLRSRRSPTTLVVGVAKFSSTPHQVQRGCWQSRIGLSYIEIGNRHKATAFLLRSLRNFGVNCSNSLHNQQRSQLILFPLLIAASLKPEKEAALVDAAKHLAKELLSDASDSPLNPATRLIRAQQRRQPRFSDSGYLDTRRSKGSEGLSPSLSAGSTHRSPVQSSHFGGRGAGSGSGAGMGRQTKAKAKAVHVSLTLNVGSDVGSGAGASVQGKGLKRVGTRRKLRSVSSMNAMNEAMEELKNTPHVGMLSSQLGRLPGVAEEEEEEPATPATPKPTLDGRPRFDSMDLDGDGLSPRTPIPGQINGGDVISPAFKSRVGSVTEGDRSPFSPAASWGRNGTTRHSLRQNREASKLRRRLDDSFINKPRQRARSGSGDVAPVVLGAGLNGSGATDNGDEEKSRPLTEEEREAATAEIDLAVEASLSSARALVRHCLHGEGPPVRAWSFPDTKSYVCIGNSATLGLVDSSFTVEAWVNVETLGEDNCILGTNRHIPQQSFHMVIRKGCLHAGHGKCDVTSTVPITLNRWHHVAYAYDASAKTQTLYQDGTLVATASSRKPLRKSCELLINRYIDGCPLQGRVAELRVWTHSRTEEQLRSYMNITIPTFAGPGDTTSLVVCWSEQMSMTVDEGVQEWTQHGEAGRVAVTLGVRLQEFGSGLALSEADAARLKEIARTAWPLLIFAFLADDRARVTFLLGVLTFCSQRLKTFNVQAISRAWCMQGLVLASLGKHEAATALMEIGYESSQSKSGPVFAHVLRTIAIYHSGIAHWPGFESNLLRATGLFVQRGDATSLTLCKQLHSLQLLITGQLRTCLQVSVTTITEAARMRESELGRVAKVMAAAALLHLGRIRECLTRLAELGDLRHLRTDRAVQGLAVATRAMVAVLQNRTEEAMKDINLGMRLATRCNMFHSFWQPAIAMLALAVLKLLARLQGTLYTLDTHGKGANVEGAVSPDSDATNRRATAYRVSFVDSSMSTMLALKKTKSDSAMVVDTSSLVGTKGSFSWGLPKANMSRSRDIVGSKAGAATTTAAASRGKMPGLAVPGRPPPPLVVAVAVAEGGAVGQGAGESDAGDGASTPGSHPLSDSTNSSRTMSSLLTSIELQSPHSMTSALGKAMLTDLSVGLDVKVPQVQLLPTPELVTPEPPAKWLATHAPPEPTSEPAMSLNGSNPSTALPAQGAIVLAAVTSIDDDYFDSDDDEEGEGVGLGSTGSMSGPAHQLQKEREKKCAELREKAATLLQLIERVAATAMPALRPWHSHLVGCAAAINGGRAEGAEAWDRALLEAQRSEMILLQLLAMRELAPLPGNQGMRQQILVLQELLNRPAVTLAGHSSP